MPAAVGFAIRDDLPAVSAQPSGERSHAADTPLPSEAIHPVVLVLIHSMPKIYRAVGTEVKGLQCTPQRRPNAKPRHVSAGTLRPGDAR